MTHMDNNIFEEPTKFDPSRFENQASIPYTAIYHLDEELVYVQVMSLQGLKV